MTEIHVQEFGQQNADEILLLHGGGLSLGGQIAVEMLSQRKNVCPYAFLESFS